MAVLALLFAIYALSPMVTSTDSRWMLHTAMSFAHGHGGDLSDYGPLLKEQDFYSIEYPEGRPHTRYPIGPALLAMPVVVALSWIRPSFTDELQRDIPRKLEQLISSAIGAAAGFVFFWVIFSRFGSMPIALASTLIFALGTSMWSTATRALWTHCPLVLMLVVAMLLLERARHRPALIQFVSLPLAAAYLMRQTAILPIVVISAYVLVFHPRWLMKYFGWSLLVAIPFIAYNLSILGRLLPDYYSGNVFTPTTTFVESLLGNLFSPSRGLFVYSPVLLFTLRGFVISLRDPAQRRLSASYAAIVVGHSIVVGAASMWWAGHSYGPRLMTDIVPFLVYFTAFNFLWPHNAHAFARKGVVAAIAALGLASVIIHAQGALYFDTWRWNYVPNNIDEFPSRSWDWSDPQFARAWTSRKF